MQPKLKLWQTVVATLFWIGFFTLLIGYNSCQAQANGFKLFELNEVSIRGQHFIGTNHHENLTGKPSQGLDLVLNVDVLKFGYFNNTIISLTSAKKFKLIGWNYRVGVHVFEFLDVEYEHFSKHTLDGIGPWQGFEFPIQDTIGFKLKFWQKNKPNSIF